MKKIFNQKTHWATEIVFLLSGALTGIASQMQWFTNRWDPFLSSFNDFAMAGNWDKEQMTLRLFVSPFVMVFFFYVLNKLIRWCLFLFPLFRSIKAEFIQKDKLIFAVFSFSILGFFGFYFDMAGLFILLLVGQLILAFYLVENNREDIINGTLFENRLLLVLFLCSGFSALVYQIVWQRALFQAFGVNIESVTIIVSIFMVGLGIGSLTGGVLSKKFPKHLPHMFIICETIIGIFGVFSLKLISVVTQATIHSSLATVSGATYGLLFIPTMFMGATLPILVSYLYKTYQNVGQSISILYFINTLGSAIACFVTTYVIFLFTGLQGAVYIAAFINLSVAYLGYKYIERGAIMSSASKETDTSPVDSSSRRTNFRYVLILFLSFVVGYISLSQEILWVRLISYTTGGKATVFSLVLGFFLVGMALGSLKANQICEKYKDRVLSIIAIFIVASSLSYFLLVPMVAKFIGLVGEGGIPFMFLGIGFISFLTGAVFPMLNHYAITSDANVGFSMSWIYCFNIIGSTAGSLVTGFFLLNIFTIEENILFISVFYFLFGVLLWFISKRDNTINRSKLIAIAVMSVILFLSFGPLYSNLLERLYHKHQYTSGSTFIHQSQSRHGIISVVAEKEGDDIITGGGIYDGRFNTDLVHNRNMIDRAYMFGALHENPKTVLEIGLSSASWAKVLAEHSDVDVLDIVEINPKYYDVIRHYPEQLSIYDDPKVSIFYDDGRRWLNRNPNKKYDFILMNTSFHWRDQINNLVSKEFLEICKAHLYEGGVLYYNSTSSLDIPYTAGHVFKYVTRYRNFVAASDSPFPVDFESKKKGLLEFRYHGKPLADQMDDALKKEKIPFSRSRNRPSLLEAVNAMANTDISDKKSKFLAIKDQLNLITDDNLASEFKTRKKFFAPSKNWLQLFGDTN